MCERQSCFDGISPLLLFYMGRTSLGRLTRNFIFFLLRTNLHFNISRDVVKCLEVKSESLPSVLSFLFFLVFFTLPSSCHKRISSCEWEEFNLIFFFTNLFRIYDCPLLFRRSSSFSYLLSSFWSVDLFFEQTVVK